MHAAVLRRLLAVMGIHAAALGYFLLYCRRMLLEWGCFQLCWGCLLLDEQDHGLTVKLNKMNTGCADAKCIPNSICTYVFLVLSSVRNFITIHTSHVW